MCINLKPASTSPSGKELEYFHWADGQPNSAGQSCSLMLDNGLWMDRDCDEKHPVICQRGSFLLHPLTLLILFLIACVSGLLGIPTCEGLRDGDYASCVSCDMFASCVDDEMIDERICAAAVEGGRTVWNDAEKKCDYTTDLCRGIERIE
jgi:hypothetical protein